MAETYCPARSAASLIICRVALASLVYIFKWKSCIHMADHHNSFGPMPGIALTTCTIGSVKSQGKPSRQRHD